MTVFRYSINYLMLLFAALLVDHYVPTCVSERPAMASRSHFAAPLLLAVVTGADRLRLAVPVPVRARRPVDGRGARPPDAGRGPGAARC